MATLVEIDPYKLVHWMNVRKKKPEHLEAAGSSVAPVLAAMERGAVVRLTAGEAGALASGVGVPLEELTHDPEPSPSVIVRSRAELLGDRRAVHRDGIHFYNYYNLPSPAGDVAPVILDILCPEGRLPALNAGHLEPALTVNLGPGDIHGRWGETAAPVDWSVLEANRTGTHPWITGASYVEPSYCRHSYSLAGGEPAQIVSYTCRSNLEALVAASNRWDEGAFGEMARTLADRGAPAALLEWELARRGWEPEAAAAAAGARASAVRAFLGGDAGALTLDEMQALGRRLGIDHRLLIAPLATHDARGKAVCSTAESIASARPFRSYRVASMAASPQLPDIVGWFMEVAKPGDGGALDLLERGSAHYLVTAGPVTLRWRAAGSAERSAVLGPGDSAWVGSFVAHGLWGHGALMKLGNGEGCTYLSLMELTNTFAVDNVLRRAHHDLRPWG